MSDRKEVTTQTTEEVQRSLEGQSPEKVQKEVKSRRGRKIKYNTDQERIEARRRRERKKKELLKLKELVEKNKKEQALTERLQRSLEGQSPEEEEHDE